MGAFRVARSASDQDYQAGMDSSLTSKRQKVIAVAADEDQSLRTRRGQRPLDRMHRDRAGTSPELFAHLFGHQGSNLGAMIFVISQTLVDLGATQVWKAAADIMDAGSVED
jgi:hypothetical protein